MKSMQIVLLAGAVVLAAPLAAAAQEGDPVAGEKAFGKCKACHTVEEGKNRVGPSLYGVVGREAGAIEGFRYSDAMQKADIVWDDENLHKYLENPKGFLPGNKMIFAGIKNPEERGNVIAYLAAQGPESAKAGDPAAPAKATD